MTHDSLDVVEFLIARDDDGLDKEFVAALGIRWWVLLHCLEEDCTGREDQPRESTTPDRGDSRTLTSDLDLKTRLDATRVWPHTVPSTL